MRGLGLDKLANNTNGIYSSRVASFLSCCKKGFYPRITARVFFIIRIIYKERTTEKDLKYQKKCKVLYALFFLSSAKPPIASNAIDAGSGVTSVSSEKLIVKPSTLESG
jgi:hypothetical protein